MGPGEVHDAESFARATDASDEAMAELERFRLSLDAASRRMNLVGPSALGEFWSRHAWDSAQLLPQLRGAATLADLGAGAGFPGVVLAILLKRRAGARVHLVESVAKRARFLQEVVDDLGLPAVVHNARAEALSPPPRVEVVTARACAPLPRLLDFAEPFLRAGARGVFLKGRASTNELAEARRTWTLAAELVESRSDPSGRIVLIEEARRVGGR
jgi:16S rRNA (guanine527-N7)-methyltransferase